MEKIIKNKALKYTWKSIKVLFSLIMFLVILIIVTQRVFNNNVSIFGYRIFTVATGSMEPVYKVMDVILVDEVDSKTLKVGDDVVYLGSSGDFRGKIITHRVTKIDDTGKIIKFYTQGVANTAEDPVVEETQIYGKVLHKVVMLSFINKIINNPIGFFFLIVVPITVLIFLEIIDRQKEIEVIEEDVQE